MRRALCFLRERVRGSSEILLALAIACRAKENAQTPPLPPPSADASAPELAALCLRPGPPRLAGCSVALSGALGTDEARVWLGARDGVIDLVLLDLTTEVWSRLTGTVDVEGNVRASELGRSGASLEAKLARDGALVGTWREPKRPPLELRLIPMKRLEEATGTRAFVGNLGSSTRIRARLERAPGTIKGAYRSAQRRDELALEGARREFEMEERAGGVKSGLFQGYFLTPTFAAGIWSSADESKRHVFTLESADAAYPEIVELGEGRRLVPKEESREVAPQCSFTRIWPEIADGPIAKKLNPSLRALAANQELTPETCKSATSELPYFSESSYAITSERPALVGLKATWTSFTGGAHEARGLSCHVLDLARGRLFELAREMSQGERDALSRLATAALQREHRQSDLTKAGFFEPSVRVSPETAICLTDKGADVIFNPYEVAPWSMGTPTAKIPMGELRPWLPPGVTP